MKRFFLMLVSFLAVVLIACGNGSEAQAASGSKGRSGDYVEVLYFHGKQRCLTCRSIEQNTRELLSSKLSRQMKDGKVVFRIIDISKDENRKMAQKYQVSWSSLFVVSHKNGKEYSENLTEFAFGNSRSAPDKFKSGLAEKITQALR